jgi:hypothetical protein
LAIGSFLLSGGLPTKSLTKAKIKNKITPEENVFPGVILYILLVLFRKNDYFPPNVSSAFLKRAWLNI